MAGMPVPSVEYSLLLPLLIVFGTAVTGVLFEAFIPRRARYLMQVLLAVGGLAAAFAAIVEVGRDLPTGGRIAVLGAVAVDGRHWYYRAPSCWSGSWPCCSSPSATSAQAFPKVRARRRRPQAPYTQV